MKKLYFIALLLTSSLVYSQGTISGTVFDGETGETIINATVQVLGTSKGAVTDFDGNFSFKLKSDTYDLKISFISYETILVKKVFVANNETTILEEIKIDQKSEEMAVFTVVGEQVRNTEGALDIIKMNDVKMLDGITSDKIKLTGDGTAGEAAKRITGVSVDGGKYIYVRGLGDRYTKTTLNGVSIPGLDPDRNSLQMDIFPSNLISNIIVSKNFTADLSPDFAGGAINIETTAFPDKKVFDVSFGMSYNPQMHFNNEFLSYEGGNTDFLGFDNGTRSLPTNANSNNIPTPISGASKEEVYDFVTSFDKELGAKQQTSLTDYSLALTFGNQFDLKNQKSKRISYIMSASYKSEYKFYDNVTYGEYQKSLESSDTELKYATVQNGQIGERQFLIGLLGGIAYKTNEDQLKFTAMHLQNAEKRAAQFNIDNNGEAVGQSGYIASSDNLEFNQRGLTNFLLEGEHIREKSNWEINWKLSPTFSSSEDPDIRKTAFTNAPLDTFFSAGAGGNPTRIWRNLNEMNLAAKVDLTKKYSFREKEGKLKFGFSEIYKSRDYEILFFDVQFFGGQNWTNSNPNKVLDQENLYTQGGNNIYFQSGNKNPNPNSYESSVNNIGLYVSNEYMLSKKLNTIVGLRAENYVQRHTGRDQLYASGDEFNGTNLEDEKVLESFDLFPSVNLIYKVKEKQNLRFSYGRTIARPSFKELSFAQILDPISNRIFNGSLFKYADWDGNLQETRIDNLDVRWELYKKVGQMISVSGFYKFFDKPIELVRIPEQQTSTEYQPRNVGDGMVLGLEFEFKTNIEMISSEKNIFSLSGNLILVNSQITMTDAEYNSRNGYIKKGESITNKRQMAGQSPFVVNCGIMFTNKESEIQSGLFYNVKGPTLYIVGAGLFPDIYTDPFHSLNFSINKKIGKDKRTKIDFKVSNLLGDNNYNYYSSFEAENQPYSEFNIGRTVSVGVSHKF
ncbi:MAG: TonB-dependent receptor [Flavobacteriales bacterium]|jgi:TonB-dependent receptor|tara:strand:+ start:2695 stop:5577 length:2883 start_codon:yes stop_codon:yes gene_type:complete